jgi:hypothetical protein
MLAPPVRDPGDRPAGVPEDLSEADLVFTFVAAP